MSESLFKRLDKDVMLQPCALEDHYPLKVGEQPTKQGPMVFGYVRTNSAQLDGCGGRTDVHDLFSLLWASVLRANGAASARLVDEDGFAGLLGEVYARWLVFDQVGEFGEARAVKSRISAHTAFAFHALEDVVGWSEIKYPQATWTDGAEQLVQALSENGEFDDFGEFAGARSFPDWHYAKSIAGRATVAVLPPGKARAFRLALAAYQPVCSIGPSRVAISACGLKNAVPTRTIARGLRLLRQVEPRSRFSWKGPGASPMDMAIALIPIESHCILIGSQTVVAIAADCGIRAYEAERTKFLERRPAEDAVFAVDYTFEWVDRLDGGRFEDLVYALLEREKGVAWVRQAGPTRERDGGRDFVARWTVSPEAGAPGPASSQTSGEGVPEPAKAKNIVVQVKAYRPSVGKAKVLDIRDTVERHNAEGFFLVAFPQPANSMVEHLTALARGGTWTDWWDRAQLESRLRKNLDLLSRFSDLVTRVDVQTAPAK